MEVGAISTENDTSGYADGLMLGNGRPVAPLSVLVVT